jgi:hypothetical protein
MNGLWHLLGKSFVPKFSFSEPFPAYFNNKTVRGSAGRICQGVQRSIRKITFSDPPVLYSNNKTVQNIARRDWRLVKAKHMRNENKPGEAEAGILERLLE